MCSVGEPVRPPSPPTQLSRPKPDTETGSRSSLTPSKHSRSHGGSIECSLLGGEDVDHQPGWRFCGFFEKLRRGLKNLSQRGRWGSARVRETYTFTIELIL
ncbi:hypothetical protein ABVK25_003549 [Lepraria finkii]|uniref:Uncharacterized protein n=1 Tax=Lepraria finkii TaxID=1340010 RepID=A0ABR4BER0_9LECA